MAKSHIGISEEITYMAHFRYLILIIVIDERLVLVIIP